jgi:hypothetical protein
MAINIRGPLKLLDFDDRVDKATQKARLAHCLECEHKLLGVCDICFCPLAAKSWVASESCPIGKWDVVNDQQES